MFKSKILTIVIAVVMVFAMSPMIAMTPMTAQADTSDYAAKGQPYDRDGDADVATVKPYLILDRVTLENVPSSSADRSITINLDVSGANKMYCETGIHIKYDQRLTLKESLPGDAIGEMEDNPHNLHCQAFQDGTNCVYLWTSGRTDPEDYTQSPFVEGRDGTMWKLTFELPENCQPGDLYPIEIWYKPEGAERADYFTTDYQPPIEYNTYLEDFGNEAAMNMQAFLYTQGCHHGFIKIHKHEWKYQENLVWTGDETNGYTKAVANYKCVAKENGRSGQFSYNHNDSVDAVITENVIPPTCTEGGKTVYTATVSKSKSLDGNEYIETKDAKPTSAKKHDWEFKGFEWTGDETNGYTKAIAKYQCKNDASHEDTVTKVTLTEKVNGLTCTKDGKTTYTATVSKDKSLDGKEHSESKDANKPKATGHKWGEWKVTKEPTTTAKGEKQRVCKNDPSHVQKQEIPVIEPKPVKKVRTPILSKMTAKGKRSLKISWTGTENADGYDVFLSRCNHGKKKTVMKKVKTIKSNEDAKYTWTKKHLKKKKAYKAVVKAWTMKDGKKTYVKTGPSMHAYTSGGTRLYSNPKSVKVKETSVTLAVDEGTNNTYKIKAKVRKVKKGKRLMPKAHAPKLRYLSSDKKIATVSKSGKITARGKGKCKIYVFAVNGVGKTVSVTVR